MTISSEKSVVQIISEKKPKTIAAIRKLGYELDLLGIGVYRRVYRIIGTDYIIKIPIGKAGILHSQNEYNACCEIKNYRKYRVLWKYMPEFSYYDESRGIIVMPYYTPVDVGRKKERRLGKALAHVMYDLFRCVWKKHDVRSIDIHDGNVALTQYGEPIMIDMGFFYGPPEDFEAPRNS